MELNENTKRAYRQNLLDAGCDEPLVRRCMELLDGLKTTEVLRELGIYRGSLLDKVHIRQKQIDVLDYLINQIKKENI